MDDAPAVARAPRKARRMAGLLAVSVLLNLAFAGYEIRRAQRKGGIRYVVEQLGLAEPVPGPPPPRADFQEELERGYRDLPPSEGGVILAGDSLIHGGPWAEFFGSIRNRGIGGETTAGFLGRLDEITARRPDALFLMLGTNDLAAEEPIGRIVANYRAILARIAAESPTTTVYVLSVLPVDQQRPGGPVHDNDSIRELNARLASLAAATPTARYLDVHDAMAGPDGRLRDEDTTDGLHLSPAGYRRLGRSLGDAVRAHLATPPATAAIP